MRAGSLKQPPSFDAGGMTFAVIASRWNGDVTDRLLEGALDALGRAGARREDIAVTRVPGAFELVSACRHAATSGAFSAVVALGCLLRGATSHFDVLSHSVAGGLAHLNATQSVPIAFGVLTCETRRQAIERSGGRAGHAGVEAAHAAVEMAALWKKR